jgi:hypothetical protein
MAVMSASFAASASALWLTALVCVRLSKRSHATDADDSRRARPAIETRCVLQEYQGIPQWPVVRRGKVGERREKDHVTVMLLSAAGKKDAAVSRWPEN